VNWGRAALRDLYAWAEERGIPEHDVKEHLRSSTAALRDRWNSWTEATLEFYMASGDLYMYDLTAWHGSGSIDDWFRRAKGWASELPPGARVLDYGAGIGTYSLILAERADIQVDALEISPALRDYIQWRAGGKTNIRPVHLIDGPYNAIICIDTIEHLPAPEYFPVLAKAALVPRGRLMATWTFHKSDGMHPMHHGPDRLSSFLRELNRTFYGPLDDGWPAKFVAHDD